MEMKRLLAKGFIVGMKSHPFYSKVKHNLSYTATWWH